MSTPLPTPDDQPATPFLGLAPFLRMSIAGADLKPGCEAALALAQTRLLDAPLWLNIAIMMQCLGQRDLGLSIHAHALELQRIYHLTARQQPASCRLLMLMEPGDLSANTPLECLLEDCDIDLIHYYLTPDDPFKVPLPEHDAVLVAMGDSDANRAHLLFLEEALANWPKPIINAPQFVPLTERATLSRVLQGIPGLRMPPTLRIGRAALQDVAEGVSQLNAAHPAYDFPIIVRPLGSQGGHGLAKITQASALAPYLMQTPDAEFFISNFIDYSHADGFFRKIRLCLIDGQPFACHMAVSSDWMVHYVNAGMYEEAWKREEELAFMTHFDDFKQRHHSTLQAIAKAIPLNYLCIDCAQTAEGELMVFELDHGMVIHAMDTEEQFPYKQIHMQKVKLAFRQMLLGRIAAHAPADTPGVA